jgi:hypothetical protein
MTAQPQDVHREIFSLLANLETTDTRYNGRAAPLGIAQSPEFAASYLARI